MMGGSEDGCHSGESTYSLLSRSPPILSELHSHLLKKNVLLGIFISDVHVSLNAQAAIHKSASTGGRRGGGSSAHTR